MYVLDGLVSQFWQLLVGMRGEVRRRNVGAGEGISVSDWVVEISMVYLIGENERGYAVCQVGKVRVNDAEVIGGVGSWCVDSDV